MDTPVAPSDLLKIIHCNCSTDCNTARCTCQKHGMKCSPACGQCRGSACLNASPLLEADDHTDTEEEDDMQWGVHMKFLLRSISSNVRKTPAMDLFEWLNIRIDCCLCVHKALHASSPRDGPWHEKRMVNLIFQELKKLIIWIFKHNTILFFTKKARQKT